MVSGQRTRNGIGLDDKGRIVELKPRYFNSAFPEMIIDSVRPGDVVRIDGVWHDGPLAFAIPDFPMRVKLAFDEHITERDLPIDQIGIEADKSRVFISYRYPFRYVVNPLQRRSCELRAFGYPAEAAS